MIISENSVPELCEFEKLMEKMNCTLNEEAKLQEEFFRKKNGWELESVVFDVLKNCAKHTDFEGTIQLVSGANFPDIVMKKLYGVEVKSTKENHWKSIGSSILESTRISGVERIFMCFGKLGVPVQFKTRPYEKCLSGISVTHYPRYQIDMELGDGETIFDRIGIKYDVLRKMENPVPPVADYYKSRLKSGESLWWALNPEEEAVSVTVRLWSALDSNEQEFFCSCGLAFFPEIVGSSLKKYNRYALWLATQNSVIDTNVRDDFSAGGKVDFTMSSGIVIKIPAVFGKIVKYKKQIIEIIHEKTESELKNFWNVEKISKNRVLQWCKLISEFSSEEESVTDEFFCKTFGVDLMEFKSAESFKLKLANGMAVVEENGVVKIPSLGKAKSSTYKIKH